MAKRDLRAAIEKSGGVQAYVDADKYADMTDEELRLAAFESRRNQEGDVTLKMANDNRRNTIMRRQGFDYFDIDEIAPHPGNYFSIDEDDIENLAGLIYHSREVQPIVVRETDDGVQIIDGERRWRAHKLLVERYGDAWRMIPAHCHALGALTDDEAIFIQNSNNLGQRRLTPSERSRGFEVLADALVEWRKNDPKLKGIKTKTYLAEHFGVSERTAMTNLTISRHLILEGKDLLDSGAITQEQAETMSRLEPGVQLEAANAIASGDVAKREVKSYLASMGGSAATRTAITRRNNLATNDYLKKARNALRRAKGSTTPASYALIGEIRQLLREIEQREIDRERGTKDVA